MARFPFSRSSELQEARQRRVRKEVTKASVAGELQDAFDAEARQGKYGPDAMTVRQSGMQPMASTVRSSEGPTDAIEMLSTLIGAVNRGEMVIDDFTVTTQPFNENVEVVLRVSPTVYRAARQPRTINGETPTPTPKFRPYYDDRYQPAGPDGPSFAAALAELETEMGLGDRPEAPPKVPAGATPARELIFDNGVPLEVESTPEAPFDASTPAWTLRRD